MNTNNNQFYREEREECENSENNSETRSHSSYNLIRKNSSLNRIRRRLKNLPQVNVSSGFDQRMAALYALELELEIRQRSASLQLRNNKIRLPDIITDFRKESL